MTIYISAGFAEMHAKILYTQMGRSPGFNLGGNILLTPSVAVAATTYAFCNLSLSLLYIEFMRFRLPILSEAFEL